LRPRVRFRRGRSAAPLTAPWRDARGDRLNQLLGGNLASGAVRVTVIDADARRPDPGVVLEVNGCDEPVRHADRRTLRRAVPPRSNPRAAP